MSLALLLGALAGCGDDSSPERDAAPDSEAPDGQAADAGSDATVETTSTVVIFHTADEHGWMQPYQATSQSAILGGIANLYSWWTELEGLDPQKDLILSGGDNWTGPSISTWFEGEPMVEAFNLMGYSASAVGNHEFDFGRDTLALRQAQADYPYLAANLTYSATGGPLEAVEPWILVQSGNVQVGVIGLAGTHTAASANPVYVSDLAFGDYAEALDEHLPALRGAGAQIVILLAHVCSSELVELLSTATPEVDVVFAGHCHQLLETSAGGIPVISSGANLRAYTVTKLTYDWQAQAVTSHETKAVSVSYGATEPNPVTPNAALEELVTYWQGEVDAELGQEIGYTATGINQGTWMMGNWATDSWLWAFPWADIAVTNFGGLRQTITAGTITLADIVGMMPFDNFIYMVEITGAELIANLQQALEYSTTLSGGYPAVAGITFTFVGGVVQVFLPGGAPLDPTATYRVLTNDYLYNGGNGYLFQSQDPDPYDTSLNYRQPVIDFTVSLATTEASPLELFLDPTSRNWN
ncbi:MAG: bifunctional UDP-sugar hydrolase/5'-nucleotidase [Polyangia bacterium]|jgi:2',3'-cyclic-nucleotide 2'-phosphodiesterase (5'-nucleotidase family)|nr:bifunctional UDP-sugar hydrolase/5'-nucleotidase [Polyangia bacterium]